MLCALLDRHCKLAHAHDRVTSESHPQPLEPALVGLTGRQPGDARSGPVGGVVAEPAADLERVVAKVRQCQVDQPTPVVLRLDEVLEDVILQTGVALDPLIPGWL